MYPQTEVIVGNHLDDYARYPHGVTHPSGTLPALWSPGDTSYANPYGFHAPNPYYDPELGGFFDVITAPFKAVVKVGKFVGGKVVIPVVKGLPKIAAGFAVGGIPGVIAAGGATLISAWTKATPQQQARIETAVIEQIANTSPYGTGPYGDSAAIAADAVWRTALGRGGEMIAATPEGRAGIARQAKTDIGSYLKPAIIPIALIAGAFILTRK